MGGMRRFWTWMFHVHDGPRTVFGVVGWWELRRIPYNLIVGSVGFVCLIIFFECIATSGVLKPGEDAVEPLAIIFAPVLMNLCYCLGWFVENILRNRPEKEHLIGPILLRLGLGFSLLVVSAPAIFWSGYRLLQICGFKD